MFQLTQQEWSNLRSQFVTSSWGGTRYLPMAFTEQGVAMLSSVLSSKIAVQVNIQIIRIFSKMKQVLMDHKDILLKLEQIEKKLNSQDEMVNRHEEEIQIIFQVIKQLLHEPQKEHRKIGFKYD